LGPRESSDSVTEKNRAKKKGRENFIKSKTMKRGVTELEMRGQHRSLNTTFAKRTVARKDLLPGARGGH